MSLRSSIKSEEVFDFKTKFCNENQIICDILRSDFKEYMNSPVLDVGAGLGDIAYNSFPDKEVLLLDNTDFSSYSSQPTHKRIKSDFFEFTPLETIKSLFICHSLQFLDEDITRLNKKILELSPETIVLVVNKNDGFMGKLIEWVNENFNSANPEYPIEGFPVKFKPCKKIDFEAVLSCPDFKVLAEQVSYLMLVELGNKEGLLITYLMENLEKPSFIINQSIILYKSYG